MKQYDAIIIGFGKAGKTLAAELSNRGWQVAVVEQSDEMYGGACPNVACIPTKTLIHESEISTLLYHNDFDKQSNMYRQAIARKMILAMMQVAAKRGCKSVHYLVSPGNQRAVRSYAHLHFTLCGEADLFGEHWLCYEKQL